MYMSTRLTYMGAWVHVLHMLQPACDCALSTRLNYMKYIGQLLASLYRAIFSSSSRACNLSACMDGPLGFKSGFMSRSNGLAVCSLYHHEQHQHESVT